MGKLSGKTAIITGASAGFGRRTAYAFAKEGCNLILTARREERLQEAAEKCRALGAQAIQMGSRFVMSEECIAHPNYKKMVLKAKDRSTVVTGRTLGHPARVLHNKLTRKYQELEAAGAPAEELEKLGVGSLHRATHEGDVDNGSVMIGEISGMLNDIKPVKTIIEDIVSGLPGVIQTIENDCK